MRGVNGVCTANGARAHGKAEAGVAREQAASRTAPSLGRGHASPSGPTVEMSGLFAGGRPGKGCPGAPAPSASSVNKVTLSVI